MKVKTQLYLEKADLERLHELSASLGRSVADLMRDAIRRTWLDDTLGGPIGVWDGPCDRPGVDHDSIYDDVGP